ncbi:MAG: hypothetical protein U0V72_03845 [Cytophagales bacterium]
MWATTTENIVQVRRINSSTYEEVFTNTSIILTKSSSNVVGAKKENIDYSNYNEVVKYLNPIIINN